MTGKATFRSHSPKLNNKLLSRGRLPSPSNAFFFLSPSQSHIHSGEATDLARYLVWTDCHTEVSYVLTLWRVAGGIREVKDVVVGSWINSNTKSLLG